MKENSKSNKVYIIRILVILILIFTLLIMRKNEPIFLAYSKGVKMLDMQFGYNILDVKQLFETLGIGGRSFYIKSLGIDFIFIASFALVQNYILKWIMGKVMLNSGWKMLLSISYLRALFDVMENVIILFLLFKFPLMLTSLITVASYITMVKFIFLGLWFLAIPVSLSVRIQMRKNIVQNN